MAGEADKGTGDGVTDTDKNTGGDTDATNTGDGNNGTDLELGKNIPEDEKGNGDKETGTELSAEETAAEAEKAEAEAEKAADDNGATDTGGEGEETSWLDAYKDVDEQFRPSEDDKELADLLATQGINIADVNKELLTGGDLSEETINKLKAVLPAAVVDMQVKAIKDSIELAALRNRYATEQVTTRTSEVLAIFGEGKDGEVGFGKFNKWASEGGLTKPEVAALNKVLSDGDIPQEIRVAAVQAYAQRMAEDPNIADAPLFKGGKGNFVQATGNAIDGNTYRSLMATEKYKTDPTYAEKVDNQRRAGLALEKGGRPDEREYPAHMTQR